MAEITFQQNPFHKALVRRPRVKQLVQLSTSSIYAAMAAGTFPRPVRIGARAVAWRLEDVESWLEARPLATATVAA
jgi:prophage regulatory protein